MQCLNPECRKAVKQRSQYVKSNSPYIATVYYFCPHCGTVFTVEKSQGDIISPGDPEETLRRVMKDIPSLTKEHLRLVYESVRALM